MGGKTSSAAHRRYHDRLWNEKRCIRCGKAMTTIKHKTCDECRAKMKDWWKR